MRHPVAGYRRLDDIDDSALADSDLDEASITDALFVIGGFNGLGSAKAWVEALENNSRCHAARAYSWRDHRSVARDITALPSGKRVTLIGYSLGGGHAQLLSQQLPAGTIDILMTVAPYGPDGMNFDLIRRNVGYWLNIISAPPRTGWRDLARNVAAPLFLNWREQGPISSASENYVSALPHQDFYKLMTDRCGPVEHGEYRSISL